MYNTSPPYPTDCRNLHRSCLRLLGAERKMRNPLSAHLLTALLTLSALLFSLSLLRADILVSAWQTNKINRYQERTGDFLGVFADVSNRNQSLAYGPDGKVYVTQYADTRHNVLRFVVNPDGSGMLDRYCPAECSAPCLKSVLPSHIIVDGTGNVLVVAGGAIHRFDPNGASLGTVGAGSVNGPSDICLGPDGYIYVPNYNWNNVTRFRPDGSVPSIVVTADELDGPPVRLAFCGEWRSVHLKLRSQRHLAMERHQRSVGVRKRYGSLRNSLRQYSANTHRWHR